MIKVGNLLFANLVVGEQREIRPTGCVGAPRDRNRATISGRLTHTIKFKLPANHNGHPIYKANSLFVVISHPCPPDPG
jgi:hypothetical protein